MPFLEPATKVNVISTAASTIHTGGGGGVFINAGVGVGIDPPPINTNWSFFFLLLKNIPTRLDAKSCLALLLFAKKQCIILVFNAIILHFI